MSLRLIQTSLLALFLGWLVLLPGTDAFSSGMRLPSAQAALQSTAQQNTAPPSAELTATPTPSLPAISSPSPTPGLSPSATAAISPSLTPSPGAVTDLPGTDTPTPSPTVSATPDGSQPPLEVIWINEVGWSGTLSSAFDEWIELHNPGSAPVELDGWVLTDSGDLNVVLRGSLAPNGFYLLERTDDSTIADIAADLIYRGGLSNQGEVLRLIDRGGRMVDQVLPLAGAWPAGSAARRASMERAGHFQGQVLWSTFNGYHGRGVDAAGRTINGSPRSINSVFFPTPTPTPIPGRVLINEVLIRPHYDWNRSGRASLDDEFIELYNRGPRQVSLAGWVLDDRRGSGSRPYTIGSVTIPAGGFHAFFRTQTRIALNDGGDQVFLLAPDGEVIDMLRYRRYRVYNLAFGRYIDGSPHLVYGLWPTPGRANHVFPRARATPAGPQPDWAAAACPQGGLPSPLILSWSRQPACARWMVELDLTICR